MAIASFMYYVGAYRAEIGPIVYRKANSKSMVASRNIGFPPYFRFRFGRKRTSGALFRQ